MLSIHAFKVNSPGAGENRQRKSAADGGQHLRKIDFRKTGISSMAILFLISCAWAEQPAKSPDEDRGNSKDSIHAVFHIKPPQGFKQEPVDETGILKWRKDSGEIYVVVGDLFFNSSAMLFKSVRKAAENDKNIQELKTLRVKGGKAILYKEKPPEDLGRLRSWRLVVVTDKKIINVDFTAPARDFESFVPAFEEAIKSFRLTSTS